MTTALLKRVYHNEGKSSPYLGLMLEVDGEGIRMSLFDQWYWEEGTDHNIEDYVGKPVDVAYSEVERDGNTYRNVTHIQPFGVEWVKPEEGMGERKPSVKHETAMEELKGGLDMVIAGLLRIRKSLE